MGALWSALRPSIPTLTEKNLPDQSGKVFIVTGSSSGVGLELAYILYLHNAKVYIAARNPTRVANAISTIKSRAPHSTGSLHPLHLDLDDLTTIKSSAEAFLKDNDRLDILWNNAGVMIPPGGSQTKQGYELQLGTNNVAPFLFTKLLSPILASTASKSPANSVRVIWVSSSGAELLSPKGGVEISNLDYHDDKSNWAKYGISKAGNVLHASEFGRRHASAGLVSVSLNPGNLKTELQRHTSGWQIRLFGWMLYEPIYGAYTELWAGLSPQVTVELNGAFIGPWGYVKPIRKDLEVAQKSKAKGGSGVAEEFWEWSEQQVKAYV